MRKYGEGCQGCIHWRSFDGYTGTKACHYILDAGVSRGCDAENCEHYSTERKELKKIKEAAERNSRRRGCAL